MMNSVSEKKLAKKSGEPLEEENDYEDEDEFEIEEDDEDLKTDFESEEEIIEELKEMDGEE